MSPRVKRTRKILDLPIIKGFKPYGPETGKIKTDPVYLLYEEYEALRLSDYDGLNHHQASLMMDVSRPTFTRIYASALEKIAKAFVEGRQIAIEGGKVYFDSDWFHCGSCHCFFNHPAKDTEVHHCPLCGQQQISKYDLEEPHPGKNSRHDICYCPACHFEQAHQPGHPCNQQICPTCGGSLKRKGTPSCRNI